VRKKDREKFSPVRVRLKTGQPCKIRFLQPSDGTKLAEFYQSVPEEDLRFYHPYPLTRDQAFQNAREALSPDRVVLVLETDCGQLAGYAWYRWRKWAKKSTFGMCIRREFQGKGAGKTLMSRLLEVARKVGPRVMSLTVQVANHPAVNLYRQMGFVILRQQRQEHRGYPHFAPEPEYYMEKRVR